MKEYILLNSHVNITSKAALYFKSDDIYYAVPTVNMIRHCYKLLE